MKSIIASVSVTDIGSFEADSNSRTGLREPFSRTFFELKTEKTEAASVADTMAPIRSALMSENPRAR